MQKNMSHTSLSFSLIQLTTRQLLSARSSHLKTATTHLFLSPSLLLRRL